MTFSYRLIFLEGMTVILDDRILLQKKNAKSAGRIDRQKKNNKVNDKKDCDITAERLLNAITSFSVRYHSLHLQRNNIPIIKHHWFNFPFFLLQTIRLRLNWTCNWKKKKKRESDLYMGTSINSRQEKNWVHARYDITLCM